MSSFLFLTFCVYVFCCLGLHFSAVPLSNPFFRWLLPVPYKPPQEPYTLPTGPVLCSASVVSLPCPQNRTQGRTGASSFFLPRTGLPLPLKGEGRGITFLGSLGLPCSFTTGPHASNRAGLLLRWCRSPTQSPDRPQIAAQGRVWFLPACWRISGGSPSLSAIPYKNSGRRKKRLCPAFENLSRLSSPLCASVSSNPVG